MPEGSLFQIAAQVVCMFIRKASGKIAWLYILMLASVDQLYARPPVDQDVAGSTSARQTTFFSGD